MYSSTSSLKEETIEKSEHSMGVLLVLFFDHLMTYLITFYREYDIKKNGVLDVYGNKRAAGESTLKIFQVFFGTLLVGYIVSHLT